VGVHPDKIGHIFDAFSQVQAGQVTGTGLGLFGVRQRAEGLSGTCGARHNTASSTGTGMVAWIAIPYIPDYHAKRSSLAAERPNSLARYNASADPDNLAMSAPSAMLPTAGVFRDRKLTAMVIDDTPTVRKLMERLLWRMGFARVDCYENGSKGLDAMMAGQVDIVFSDVQMPIMTGPEVITFLFPLLSLFLSFVSLCCPFAVLQMIARFREWERGALERGDRTQRQLVIAVTANGAQLGSGGGGFDLVCPKPLGAQDIQRVVQEQFC
jgi:CheY-like chemotaxis protein